MEKSIEGIIQLVSHNETIMQSFLKTKQILSMFERPMCSISGGKDSDIMLDMVIKLDVEKKVKYVFFDTGIEYKATREHLNYLEEKYEIKIDRQKATKPIPVTCKEYGQPFLSKLISGHIESLQRHGFEFEDGTYEELTSKYDGCASALRWWTNKNNSEKFNIEYNAYLKDFLIDNPPTFQISDKCCQYAKKDPSHKYETEHNCDLRITGIRRSEGGVRAAAYKDCFTDNTGTENMSAYRPLFWYTQEDEKEYDRIFGLRHSDCYEVYGYVRTGCAGCPFDKDVLENQKIAEKYEPNFAKAAANIFSDSYEYTKTHHEYVEQKQKIYRDAKKIAKYEFDKWCWRQNGYDAIKPLCVKKGFYDAIRKEFVDKRIVELLAG